MSKPMLIPPNILIFKHPHIGKPWDEQTAGLPPRPEDTLFCETHRPVIDASVLPMLGEAIRDFTPCGQEIYWRLK